MLNSTRSMLDNDLATLQEKLLLLSGMADTAISQAMQSLYNRDVLLAQSVVHNDEQINVLRYEIEQDCLRVLATQAPAASDLRTVLVFTHIAIELERIADHASGIARIVARMETLDEIDSLHKLPKMEKRARGMLTDVMQACVNKDVPLAEKIISKDEKINRHNEKLFESSMNTMQEDSYIYRGTYLIWVGHNLERIGDRIKNIAERIIFMVNGDFVEIMPPNFADEDDHDAPPAL